MMNENKGGKQGENLMEKIVSLAKRRGFIFPGSEIYGGLAGTWDYGPLGVELKEHIKREFWRFMTREHENVVGMDAAILMNAKVWEASGHAKAFTDPLVECKSCHVRLRPEDQQEIEAHEESHRGKKEEFSWTEPKKFNLLVEAKLGAVEEEKSSVYLRGEITQGVHVNFKNILDSTRVKIPFGVAQTGKAFRNEITPGNFTFRSREFEQMELQFFIFPDGNEANKWFNFWKEERMRWFVSLGIKKEKLRFREHAEDERAHYARAACDIEYDAPFGGWKEMEGIHNRGDWDLSQHAKFSGEEISYFDEESKQKFVPWVIETSGGVDRAALFFLVDAYTEEGERVILKLHPKIAPIKVAVFPLVSNKEPLVVKAREIYNMLKPRVITSWDDRGNIGKRYFSQDEIGTPWCVTIDYKTLEDETVTVRERDTAKQQRMRKDELVRYFREKLI